MLAPPTNVMSQVRSWPQPVAVVNGSCAIPRIELGQKTYVVTKEAILITNGNMNRKRLSLDRGEIAD